MGELLGIEPDWTRRAVGVRMQMCVREPSDTSIQILHSTDSP
jgi:hypothetical protein